MSTNTEHDVALWADAQWYDREARRLGYEPHAHNPMTDDIWWFSIASVPCWVVDARTACEDHGVTRHV